MDCINIAIFECSPYSANKGVAALAYSALTLIDEIARKKFKNYALYIVNDNVTKFEDSFYANGHNINFFCIKPISWINIKDILRFCFFAFLPHGCYKYHKYLEFDYIFNVGSGDSFADIYGKERFNRVNNNITVCHLLSKKQMLLPQTIGPFSDSQILNKALLSIRRCSYVLSRDMQSLLFLQNNNIPNEKISEIIDMAFYLPYSYKKIKDSFIHIGINVSGLLWQGGYTKDNQFKLTLDYKDLIFKLIKYFTSKNNICVHLIGHTISRNLRAPENDYSICKDLVNKRNSKNLILAPFFETPMDAKSYISSMDFFIGARMHATIAAFSSNTPVVPMSYSRKFEGLFCDTLNYRHVTDMRNSDTTESFNYIIDMYHNRAKLKMEIEEINNKLVKEKKVILMNYIDQFMK